MQSTSEEQTTSLRGAEASKLANELQPVEISEDPQTSSPRRIMSLPNGFVEAPPPRKMPEDAMTGDWPKGQGHGWFRKNQVLFWSFWKRTKLLMKKTNATCVVPMPFNKIVKFGKQVYLSEVSALQHVAATTSIPVPKFFSAFKKDGFTYIVMEKIEGIVIHHVWEEDMSREDQQRVGRELKDYFELLR
jgi:hypothetical protein